MAAGKKAVLFDDIIQAGELVSFEGPRSPSNLWKIASEEGMKSLPREYSVQVTNKLAIGAMGVAGQEAA